MGQFVLSGVNTAITFGCTLDRDPPKKGGVDSESSSGLWGRHPGEKAYLTNRGLKAMNRYQTLSCEEGCASGAM